MPPSLPEVRRVRDPRERLRPPEQSMRVSQSIAIDGGINVVCDAGHTSLAYEGLFVLSSSDQTDTPHGGVRIGMDDEGKVQKKCFW